MSRTSATEGSVTKRCSCKDPDTGKRLGTGCPKLRRAGGAWSSTHGSWGYQLELPTLPGRPRRQLRRFGFARSEDAARELDHARSLLALAAEQVLAVQIGDMLHDCKPGTPLPDRDAVAARIRAGVPATVPTTVAEYLAQWLAGRRGLSPNTMRSYSDHIRLYLTPHLGNIALQQLRTVHIQAMFTALEERNDAVRAARASADPAIRATVKGVRPMEATSMALLFATLRKALNDAMFKAKLIPDNPALGVELAPAKRARPRVWTPRAVKHWQETGQRPSPVMVWTPQQAGAFLDYVKVHEPRLYTLYTLILHRGLRRGEACGLRDHDVDLDIGCLTVVEQITSVGYQAITRDVKSRAGDRIVPLGPTTTRELADYLVLRQSWQDAAGDEWTKSGLFFVRPDGRAWHPEYISDRFEALLAASGLPSVRLHDLRHCAATYLRHGGADMKEVQETLGHSTLAVTADIYTSVILELRRTHADAAADIIPRTTKAA
jgi:integrase